MAGLGGDAFVVIASGLAGGEPCARSRSKSSTACPCGFTSADTDHDHHTAYPAHPRLYPCFRRLTKSLYGAALKARLARKIKLLGENHSQNLTRSVVGRLALKTASGRCSLVLSLAKSA